ncbi:unnamed protein product [Amoebophrya sp. A25]|nr:unnamed protein product [Amoebophrya sp. A25]|eukprot:GSA25T00026189001.1
MAGPPRPKRWICSAVVLASSPAPSAGLSRSSDAVPNRSASKARTVSKTRGGFVETGALLGNLVGPWLGSMCTVSKGLSSCCETSSITLAGTTGAATASLNTSTSREAAGASASEGRAQRSSCREDGRLTRRDEEHDRLRGVLVEPHVDKDTDLQRPRERQHDHQQDKEDDYWNKKPPPPTALCAPCLGTDVTDTLVRVQHSVGSSGTQSDRLIVRGSYSGIGTTFEAGGQPVTWKRQTVGRSNSKQGTKLVQELFSSTGRGSKDPASRIQNRLDEEGYLADESLRWDTSSDGSEGEGQRHVQYEDEDRTRPYHGCGEGHARSAGSGIDMNEKRTSSPASPLMRRGSIQIRETPLDGRRREHSTTTLSVGGGASSSSILGQQPQRSGTTMLDQRLYPKILSDESSGNKRDTSAEVSRLSGRRAGIFFPPNNHRETSHVLRYPDSPVVVGPAVRGRSVGKREQADLHKKPPILGGGGLDEHISGKPSRAAAGVTRKNSAMSSSKKKHMQDAHHPLQPGGTFGQQLGSGPLTRGQHDPLSNIPDRHGGTTMSLNCVSAAFDFWCPQTPTTTAPLSRSTPPPRNADELLTSTSTGRRKAGKKVTMPEFPAQLLKEMKSSSALNSSSTTFATSSSCVAADALRRPEETEKLLQEHEDEEEPRRLRNEPCKSEADQTSGEQMDADCEDGNGLERGGAPPADEDEDEILLRTRRDLWQRYSAASHPVTRM